jgi:hypothetical protein
MHSRIRNIKSMNVVKELTIDTLQDDVDFNFIRRTDDDDKSGVVVGDIEEEGNDDDDEATAVTIILVLVSLFRLPILYCRLSGVLNAVGLCFSQQGYDRI